MKAIGWLFFALVALVGVANFVLVHPVPGLAYFALSLVFQPPVNAKLKAALGFSIHPVAKVLLAILIVQFTLGVSDLGDMIDSGS